MGGKTCRAFLILLVITFALGIFSLPVKGEEKESYQSLLAKLKKFDRPVDFKALRLAYTETPEYKPYEQKDEERNAMFTALKAKEYEKALKSAQSILEHNYVDLDAHYVSQSSYRALNNPKEYAYHRTVFRGLLDSILNSGDGKSPQTAYLVINISEEYVVLGYLGYKFKRQSLISADGHRYDKMEVIQKESGDSSVIYFNVDLPMGWLSKSLK